MYLAPKASPKVTSVPVSPVHLMAAPMASSSLALAVSQGMNASVRAYIEAKVASPQKEIPATVEAANMSNQMTHILQAMPSGVVMLSGEGVVTLANPVATELLGRPLQGMRWLDIIHRAFAPQEDDGHEVSLKDGRRVKLAITPLTPEPGLLIVLTDLTETRLLQKNLSHLQRLSALGKMVATLAHQVRTPLSAALLYASNLANTKLNEASRSKFQSKLVDRLNELERQVNDMLLMAKGRQDDLAEKVTLSQVIDRVLGNCEPIAEQKGCELSVVDTSTALMSANSNALSSAINNLVLNSIEAGATKVQLSASETEKGLVLDVIDNGKGMAPAMQQQVLEPFFTTKTQGTGLGLAVVQSVVRSHGGSLQLFSKESMGCHIRLLFPHVNNTPLEE